MGPVWVPCGSCIDPMWVLYGSHVDMLAKFCHPVDSFQFGVWFWARVQFARLSSDVKKYKY